MERPNLHDATVLEIVLRWGTEAGVEVRFRDSSARMVSLTVRNVTLLHCPHENPWGPSISVNELRLLEGVRDGTQRVEIEVQSGDTVVIEGRGVEWELSDSS